MKEVLGLAGGLAFFLYGMQLCAEALKSGSNRALQRIIEQMIHGKIRGTLFGIGVTLFTQSSGATSVLVLSMVNTSIITLSESAPILLGGSIGTSFTVQLISFKITEYALIPVFWGIVLQIFARSERWKMAGAVLLGFGLIFLGMEMMVQTVKPLVNHPGVPAAVAWLSDRPWAGFLAATVFTALIQSSGAVIGLLISLSIAGAGQAPGQVLAAIFPLVLGANLGACITAFWAAIGTRREAKRVAVLQLVLRLAAVLIVWPFSNFFVQGVMLLGSQNASRAIANAHTLFNIVTTIVLLPVTGLLTVLVRKLMPPKGDDSEYRPTCLDPNLVSTPGMALDALQRELVQLSRRTNNQIRDIPRCFFGDNRVRICQQLENRDGQIDRAYAAISDYINKILGQRTTHFVREQGERQFVCAAALESMADIAVKNILPLAKKYARQGENFSQEGKEELLHLHGRIMQALGNLEKALAAANAPDWKKLIEQCEDISQYVDTLKLRHLDRLVRGAPSSTETSAIHLDLIENLRRIENGIKHIGASYLLRDVSNWSILKINNMSEVQDDRCSP